MKNNNMQSKVWVVVPAAGSGSRFAADRAKQFYPLKGLTMAEVTLQRLLAIPAVAGIVVAKNPQDSHWDEVQALQDAKVLSVAGGRERADSVLAGLQALSAKLGPSDWVMVHDIARPCLHSDDVEKLLATLSDDPVGGLLVAPVTETLKQIAGEEVVKTHDRRMFALAQTPQLFRYGVLCSALETATSSGAAVTDEASAVELAGLSVRTVSGRADNLKVTVAEQLPIAEAIMAAQEQEEPKK